MTMDFDLTEVDAITWQNGCFYLLHDGNRQKLPHPWELPDGVQIRNLLIDHAMQYLTSMEADLAMINWVKALPKGSYVTVKVPDADYFAQLWLNADWQNETLKDASSDARSAFAGLWGQQVAGNPRNDNYAPGHSGAFLSGYNLRRLTLLLQRVGLFEITKQASDDGELIVQAVKTMDRGERQIVANRDDVRPDHLNRYEFAAQQLANSGDKHILDLACGVGYGSQLLALQTGASVTAVDIDVAAINHAKQFFSAANIEYLLGDAREIAFSEATFDAIVSFETIEHVDFADSLVKQYYRWLKPGGVLICSTPNQDVMPFDKGKFRFHVKHYTNTELLSLLQQAGFNDIRLYAQRDPVCGLVVEGDDGHFTVALARK